MAPADPPHGKPSAPDQPMPGNRLECVRRASGLVATVTGPPRRGPPIHPDERHRDLGRHPGHPHCTPTATSASFTRLTNSWNSISAASASAPTTTSNPPLGAAAATASRRRLRARLRATAPPRPTFATSPTRKASPRTLLAHATVTPSFRARRPVLKISRYCLLFERDLKTGIARDRAHNPSGRQPASPLRPPGFQDRPAGAGTHARAKPVLALATAGIGLKGALRHQIHLRSICRTGPRKIVVAKS